MFRYFTGLSKWQEKSTLSRTTEAIETFHSVIAIPVITNLIVEIEDVFDTKDFPVIDAFHAFDPRNIPTIVPLKYGLNEEKIIYSNHGNNKVNIYQEQRNGASAILECSEEIFYQQCSDYFQLISRKKAERMKEYETKKGLLTTKLNKQGKKKKCTVKTIKQTKGQLGTAVNEIKNPFSLKEAVYLCSKILPVISAVLNIIAICLASGAAVERGFSLMNLIINDLRSSMNIRTLDATMGIHCNGPNLSDEEADKIIDVWKRELNRGFI